MKVIFGWMVFIIVLLIVWVSFGLTIREVQKDYKSNPIQTCQCTCPK